MNSNNEIVNSRIRYYMSLKQMTVAELSKRINKSYQYTHRLVNGIAGKTHSLNTLQMLAGAFDVTVVDMITPLSQDVDVGKIIDGRKKQKKI